MKEHTFTSYGLGEQCKRLVCPLVFFLSKTRSQTPFHVDLSSQQSHEVDACRGPLIRDGPGSDVDAKEAQVYSVRGNAQAEKIANTPFPIPFKRLRFFAPDAKSWRLAAMSCIVRVDPMPMLVMNRNWL